MGNIQYIHEFVDIFHLHDRTVFICKYDPVMLARLACVDKTLYTTIGSCRGLLEGLIDSDYLTSDKMIMITAYYGKPSHHLVDCYRKSIVKKCMPRHKSLSERVLRYMADIVTCNGDHQSICGHVMMSDSMLLIAFSSVFVKKFAWISLWAESFNNSDW